MAAHLISTFFLLGWGVVACLFIGTFSAFFASLAFSSAFLSHFSLAERGFDLTSFFSSFLGAFLGSGLRSFLGSFLGSFFGSFEDFGYSLIAFC